MPSGKLFEGLGSIVASRLNFPSVVDFTAAQVTTLNSIPVDTIQSPGAGLVICPIGAAWQYKPGSQAFSNAVTLKLIWSDGTELAQVTSVPLDALTAKQGLFAMASPGGGDGSSASLQLSAASDPGGTGNGTLRVIVCYMILPMR